MVTRLAMGMNLLIVGFMVYLYGVEVGKSQQISVDISEQIDYAVYRAIAEGLE